MLLARENGLHTAAQEAWAFWQGTVREVLAIPDEEMVFCGMAIGFADEDAPVNSLQSPRVPLDEFAVFVNPD